MWGGGGVQQTEGTRDGQANVQGFFFSFFGEKERKEFGKDNMKKIGSGEEIMKRQSLRAG